ncbi:MAG: lanthionine synthetase LanC family protein [Polyangiales bacterium]
MDPHAPLIDGALATEARAALDAVVAKLRALPPEADVEPTLFDAAGPALLFAALGRTNDAAERLDRCVARASDVELSTDLHRGVAGLAWVIERVGQGGDANDAVDEALLDALAQEPWPGDFDLMHGLAGTAVYALERAHLPSGAALLARLVAQLGALSSEAPGGRLWLTTRAMVPSFRAGGRFPQVDCGALHGQPGVLAALAGAAAWDVPGARALLDDGVGAFLRLVGEGDDGGRVPGCYPLANGPSRSARNVWCYGDLGAAATLLAAARTAREPAWERIALDLARHAARHGDPPGTIRDAQLCHGAAGVGHCFHRLYRATGEAVFRDRAVAWFAHCLTLRGEDGAFPSWRTQPPPDRWAFDAGYLEGNAGVGLALADALGLASLPWDRPLALSLRTP